MPRRDVKLRIDESLAAMKKLPPARSSDDPKVDLAILAKDRAVQHAFKVAGRDPTVIGECLAILIAVLNARFGPAERGAEKVWDSARLSSLLASFLRLRQKHPTFSDGQLCKKITETVRLFEKNKASRLRRMLSDALDPAKNLLLKHVLANFPPEVLLADQKRRQRKISWEALPDHWDEAKVELTAA